MKSTAKFILLTFSTLLFVFMARPSSAQNCAGITYSFEHYEPCRFRAKYANITDCYTEIRYILESGTFSTWSVNDAAGFTVDVVSPSELWIHHTQGFLPLGNQVPLLFTLPTDLNTTMFVAYNDQCAQIGCEVPGGIPIESCPDPQDASIIGVKYRECGNLPYSNQPVISGWTIQLLDDMGNVLGEQVTDADGAYAFYDLHAAPYIIREALLPDWTPKVPATGEYLVDLGASEQVVRNFGNCPIDCNASCPANLVTNPGFENGPQGFPNAQDQINLCTDWHAATNGGTVSGTGDWYSTLNPIYPGYFNDVPNQQNSPLPPHCGSKYAGFNLNSCEGISSTLSSPITQGCSYDVGFWWSPAEPVTAPFSFFAVLSGGNCTVYNPSGSCSHQCGGDQHVVVNVLPGTHVPGTWYFHSTTITNAYPNVSTITFTAAQSQPMVDNYIFVDDICLTKNIDPCSVTAGLECFPTINPTAYSALATLGCGSSVTQVDWYFDGTGPNPSSSNLNSVVHPFTTLGIHTICLVVTASNDGGATTCRDTFCKDVEIIKVPPTKCDSVGVFWQKLHTPEELCCYSLQIDNMVPSCFNQIELTLSSGTFANASVTLGWNVSGPLTGNHIYLSPASGGFVPASFFSPITICQPGGSNPHVLSVNLLSGLPQSVDTCRWDFTYDCFEAPLDSCCLDFDLFCQNVMNAVNITVDNANCKAKFTIGNLPGCDYIEYIKWGDGASENGQLVAGDMFMHNYAQSGTYIIEYLAIEVNPHTGLICFEKIIRDTIVLDCIPCPECPNNLVQNPGFFGGAVSGNLGNPGASNNWTVASGSPQVATTISCCDPVSIQMWGNQDLGEAICQTGFIFDPAKTYSISFSAQFYQPGLPTPYVRFGFTAANACIDPFTCISPNCELIGESGQITNQNCASYTLPNWTPTANWSNLIIRAFNNTPNVPGDATTISWGRIDNVCIQEVMDSCCADSLTFCNLVAQGFTVVQSNCTVTVTAPQFDSCYYFSTPPILDGGPGIQVITDPSGSWTYTFTQSGVHQICVLVFDECNSKMMCTTVDVACDTCYCGAFSDLLIRPNSGPSIPVACGGTAPLIACPPNGQNLPITGVFLCQGTCPPTTTVDWMLFDPSGAMVISATGVQADPNFGINIAQNFLDQPGVYCIKLTGYCGGEPCPPCLIKFQLEFPCDTCCKDYDKFLALAQNVELFGTLGNCTLSYQATGLNDCMQITYDWGDGSGTEGPFADNTLVTHTYPGTGTYYVCYTIEEVNSSGAVCWEYIKCDSVYVICDVGMGCVTAPADLVAWWPMDESIGDDNVADIIHFYEGDPKPNGIVGIPDGPDPVPGKVGGALHFVSVPGSTYVEVSDAPGLNFGSGSFSIDAWINTNMGTQTEPIVDKLGSSNLGYSFSIQGVSPYYPTLVIGQTSTVQFLQGPPIVPGDWNFVAVTVSSQKATFYVGNSTSGFTQSSVNISGTNNATNSSRPLLIGNNPFNPHWDITIDELEIFSRELDSLEIKSIWSADSLGKCKDLVAVDGSTKEHRFRIFPNPNHGTFSVELPQAATPGMVFRVIGLTGQVLVEHQTQTGMALQVVQVQDLPCGLYFLQVLSEGKVRAVEKFVKQ